MNFNEHSKLRGQHATFSPSQSAWLRYSEEKILDKYQEQYNTQLGTELHEFAASQITLGIKQTNVRNIVNDIKTYIYRKYLDDDVVLSSYGKKLIDSVKFLQPEAFETLKMYVNDGIGFKMTPEQPLYYSDHFFGTADTIDFRNNHLRIHDLKTGVKPAHMEQLRIYAALFCLEYNIKPGDIIIDLNMYQRGVIYDDHPTAADILPIMDTIIRFDKVITN